MVEYLSGCKRLLVFNVSDAVLRPQWQASSQAKQLLQKPCCVSSAGAQLQDQVYAVGFC